MTDPVERASATPDADGTRQGAPARAPVLLLETDLFFAVKISDTLAHAGYVTHRARTLADFCHRLVELKPELAIVNTAVRGLDWRAAIAAAREADVPVLAFGAHVDLETQAAARTAGATRVVSNSRLTRDLPGIVARMPRAGAGGGAPPEDDAWQDEA